MPESYPNPNATERDQNAAELEDRMRFAAGQKLGPAAIDRATMADLQRTLEPSAAELGVE
jgi:hypothetical protein